MKLTNMIREAFVRAAMNDVPQVDHADLIRNEHRKLVAANLPKSIQVALKDPEDARFLQYRDYAVPGVGLGSFPSNARYSRAFSGDDAWHEVIPAEDRERLRAMLADKVLQDKKLEQLERRLGAVATSCTTRKALADALPEFEKYLPADAPAASRMVPVLANVVDEFTKAGWPKGKKG